MLSRLTAFAADCTQRVSPPAVKIRETRHFLVDSSGKRERERERERSEDGRSSALLLSLQDRQIDEGEDWSGR